MKMMSLMTHEMRGPLVSVMAGLKLVRHGCFGAMDAGVSAKLDELGARLNRLLGTADDYLGLACCLENELRMPHEPLDLEEDVLAVVLDELSGEAQTNGTHLQRCLEGLPAGTRVAANRLGMKIVFRNLIRNAVRYGRAGCTVAFGYRAQPAHHRLNVFNSGTPIPSECRERLFTRFGTLGNHEQGRRVGVGLGLYLTREIVRTHGGEIWYEGLPEGSNFVFTVPKVPPPPPGGGDAPEA